MACITLLTDYGTRDHYVGAMKGVIQSLAPGVSIVDITHEIQPYHVLHAAFVLRQIWSWYPPGTIHVAVVDPGVGTERRILLGRYAGQYVLAPDNGLVSMVHSEVPIEELRVVENLRLCLPVISDTFHGRDIMAPVAARLASGKAAPREVGPITDRLEVLRIAAPGFDPALGLLGTVLYIDRFGNGVTNLRPQDFRRLPRADDRQVLVNDRPIGPVRARFADVPRGEPLALFGSSEYLEISVNQGSAAELLQLGSSTVVQVR